MLLMAAALPQETPRPAVRGTVEPQAAEHRSDICQPVLVPQLVSAAVVLQCFASKLVGGT